MYNRRKAPIAYSDYSNQCTYVELEQVRHEHGLLEPVQLLLEPVQLEQVRHEQLALEQVELELKQLQLEQVLLELVRSIKYSTT